jgi:hypothetical protein
MPGHVYLVSDNPRQQIRQAVSRQNHPPIRNPARTNNVAHWKHGSRCDHRAIHVPAPRHPGPSPVSVSDLRRNLKTLLCPRLKAAVPKFGELIPLKLLSVAERRGRVS